MIACFVLLSAQITLRGTVVAAESHEPLGFSIVALHPGFAQRFTDARGAFAFEGAQPGTYLLSVRQIGYAPLDTQLVIPSDSVTMLRVLLHHLAIELPPVAVAAVQCTKPGPPDSSDMALRIAFDQLQDNARRFELLSRKYPFEYVLEVSNREVNQRGDSGRRNTRRLYFSSRDDHPYAVGGVVELSWGPWGNTGNVVHTGDLHDLDSPSFIANHCFQLAGHDTIAGETLLRINFEPATRIWSTDMAGAAYLDTSSYELRYTEITLTHPERSDLENVLTVTARTHFRNIAPGVPLEDTLVALWTYRSHRMRVESHRTMQVRFRRKPPST